MKDCKDCTSWETSLNCRDCYDKDSYNHKQIIKKSPMKEIEDSNKLNQMAIKLISDEKIGLKPAFSYAFEQFDDILNRCDNLLIWGHSFRDLQVLKSIITSIKNNKKLKNEKTKKEDS
jgi:hypothetical protein